MIFVQLLTALVCGAVCLISLRDIRTNLLRILVFAGYGLIHGLVPALTPPELLTYNFSDASRYDASLFALASALFMAAGWFTFELWKRPDARLSNKVFTAISSKEVQTFFRRLFWISMIAGLAGSAIFVRGTGASLSELAHSSSRFQYRLSGDTLLMALGNDLSCLAFVPGFLCMFLSRPYRIVGIIFMVVMSLAGFFVLSVGSRSGPLAMLGTLGVSYLFPREISPRRFVFFMSGCLLLLWLAVSLYEVRRVMKQQSASATVSLLFTPSTYQSALVSDPLNYNETLVGAIDTFPQRYPFLNAATYRRILLFFLPRSVAPSLKPDDTNIVFALDVFHTRPDFSTTIPPSLPGDAYVNWWGWPGLSMMFLNGVIMAWGNSKLFTNLFWFTVLGPEFARFALVVLRGQPYDIFSLLMFVTVATWLLAKLCGFNFKRSGVVPNSRDRAGPVRAHPTAV